MSKRLGGIIGCKDKTSSWHLIGFSGSPMVVLIVTYGQEYNVGEKPTVMMYTYTNLHAGTPINKTTQVLLQDITFLLHIMPPRKGLQ